MEASRHLHRSLPELPCPHKSPSKTQAHASKLCPRSKLHTSQINHEACLESGVHEVQSVSNFVRKILWRQKHSLQYPGSQPPLVAFRSSDLCPNLRLRRQLFHLHVRWTETRQWQLRPAWSQRCRVMDDPLSHLNAVSQDLRVAFRSELASAPTSAYGVGFPSTSGRRSAYTVGTRKSCWEPAQADGFTVDTASARLPRSRHQSARPR